MWSRDLSGLITGLEFLSRQNPAAFNPGERLHDLIPACAQLTQAMPISWPTLLWQPLYSEWSPPRTNSVHAHSMHAEKEVAKKGQRMAGSLAPITHQHPRPRQQSSGEARILNACMPCASQHRPYPTSLCHLPFPKGSKRRSMWVTLTFMKITSQRPAGLEGHWRLSSPNHLNSQMRNQGS